MFDIFGYWFEFGFDFGLVVAQYDLVSCVDYTNIGVGVNFVGLVVASSINVVSLASDCNQVSVLFVDIDNNMYVGTARFSLLELVIKHVVRVVAGGGDSGDDDGGNDGNDAKVEGEEVDEDNEVDDKSEYDSKLDANRQQKQPRRFSIYSSCT